MAVACCGRGSSNFLTHAHAQLLPPAQQLLQLPYGVHMVFEHTEELRDALLIQPGRLAARCATPRAGAGRLAAAPQLRCCCRQRIQAALDAARTARAQLCTQAVQCSADAGLAAA